ncbi:MAG: cytochrome C oxidase subunit IV family protein [Alphaproteobacteria bacterium]
MTREIGRLVLVWLVLVALLAVAVGLSFVPLGALSPALNMGIAVVKAALVAWYFMHLRHESGLIRLAALGAMLWIFLLLLLMATDYVARDAFPG